MFHKLRKGQGSEGKGRQNRQSDTVRQPRLMRGQEDYAFRRSRTLTGSLSSSVESTAARRPDLKSDRLKLHELHAHRRAVKVGLSTCIILMAVISFLIGNSVPFADKNYVASGVLPETDRAIIDQAINDYLNKNPFQAFLITLSEDRLTKALQNDHPEIETVKVSNAGFGLDGSLAITFRQPVAVWQIGNQRYYVDENGSAFIKHFGEDPELRVEDISGYDPASNGGQSPIASKRFMGYLGQLLGAIRLQDAGDVERIVIPVAARQLDIYMSGREYPVKTHVDRDPYGQVEDIKHVLGHFDNKNIVPEYVDVRVEGKAFYK